MSWRLPNEPGIGCSPYPMKTGRPQLCCHPMCHTYEDKPKLEREDTSTGSCLQSSKSRSEWLPSSPPLSPVPMSRLADQLQPMNMYGRMTPQSPEPDLRWVNGLCEGTLKPTGTGFGPPPSPEICWESKQMFVFNIIAPCVQSAQITLNLLLLNVRSLSFMDLQALESLEEPGKKPVGRLILRIREASFGMDTEIRRTLFLTNFEEVSISPMYCDGLIATQSLWRSKELPPVW
nr:hypothetical protein [Cressdnaviricota sp.]UOF77811.1 hypothetical protein [Cressdnaviricota sp.]UOF78329.1 hypothetical protein [Cressdnaviricota sp.]UOF80968.1 hypothetical protein [Cressdnaviricota sp.]UOF82190.1 hypothetical protein [Cressdnaviricota sp.]